MGTIRWVRYKFNLIYNGECFHIDPYIEDFSLITKRKGLKGFFFSYSEKFWMIIAKIVKNKIKEILKQTKQD